MSKKTKVLIPLAVAVVAVAVTAYLKYPVSAPSDTSPKGNQASQTQPAAQPAAEEAATRIKQAPTAGAAVDAAVDAVIQGYDPDQTIAAQEDGDTSIINNGSNTINSLNEVYNENDF
ncbi:MAG: hypothetical protein M1383_00215 [Patescibacteria group bacterium]|nr:hypothetical protein [Patescibacteria group bacterium]